jgi:hypothetical protein
MTLAAGTRLGAYEIVALIGGMHLAPGKMALL